MMPSPQQIANLRRLADFLDDNAEKLVYFDQFDMDAYRHSEMETSYASGWDPAVQPHIVDDEIVDPLTLGCGTAACAAGWAATLPGMQPVKDDFEALGTKYRTLIQAYAIGKIPRLPTQCFNWNGYILRVFGLAWFMPQQELCFGWDKPNDPREVAKTLRTVADDFEQERAA